MLDLLGAISVGLFLLQLLRYTPPHTEPSIHRNTNLLFRSYISLRFLVIVLSLLYSLHILLLLLPQFFPEYTPAIQIYPWTHFIINWLLCFTLYQISSTAIYILGKSLCMLPTRKERTIALVMVAISRSIKTAILVLSFIALLQYFYHPSVWIPGKETIYHFSIILGFAWFSFQLIRTAEAIFNLQYSPLDEDLDSRKTHTHIVLIKRVALILLTALTLAALLMSVQEVRNLGKGILISTGIATALFSVSSKQPLEGLMRGIQLAITQPIRINDTIIVEGELGIVSEINLTHVMVTLWDKRQMIVPTHYFLEKPFQNWTHESKDLLGSIFFYVDYQLPVEQIRQKFYEYIESNELGLWNGHLKLLQVTDIKNNQVELRMLVSADDPEKLFDLCCDIREKMLYTIQQNYPEGWPKFRVELPSAHHTSEPV